MDRMVFDKLKYGLYVVGVFEGGRRGAGPAARPHL